MNPGLIASTLFLFATWSLVQSDDGQVIAATSTSGNRTTSSVPCSSCLMANTPPTTGRQFQLPPGLAETVQVFASKVFKAFSLYQPELHGLTCVLKYYKLLTFINLPSSMEDYLTLFGRFRTNSTPPPDNTSSARTFFPFPDLDLKEKQIVQLTLWHCAKVYLFSFFVRFLEIIYFI